MTQDGWKRVAAERDLKEGRATVATIGDRQVLVTKVKGKICACGNACPHYGAPLSHGSIEGALVTCPWHDAKFDLRDGSMQSPPALDDLPVYAVKVEAGEVWLGAADEPEIAHISNGDDRTFVILGGGAAGAVAAETLRRVGFGGEIIVFSAEADLPYDRTMLSKSMISGDAKPEWLLLRDGSFYERLSIKFRGGYRANRIDPQQKVVYFDNGRRQPADKILLATGSKPRPLPVAGAEKANHFLLRSADDARAIVECVASAGSAVIVGASFIGLEVAAGLVQRQIEVHVVAPESEPLELVFGKEIGRRLRTLHEDKGVRFHLGHTVSEIQGFDSVEGVVLRDGTKLHADMVITGIGVDPVTDYLADTGIVRNGVVPVDSRLETTVPGIYAAGDIALVPYSAIGESARVEHWVVAESQGQHAARAMAGAEDPYNRVPFFWTRQYDISIKYLGYPGGYDRVVFRGKPEDGPFVAGFYRDGTLRGAATIGMGDVLTRIERYLAGGKELPAERFEDRDDAL